VRAINDKERGFGDRTIIIDESAQNTICDLSNGDARSALNMLEFIVLSDKNKTLHITLDSVKESVQKHYLYDRAGEEHYNLISALHKSLRDSQADASLYWMARMLEGGEDPLFIARRLIRFAS
ncbi:MAG: AAA family ATPase, partial [Zetaproteobacteria bacterium CG_4_9_14_3_um_filter_53_7]